MNLEIVSPEATLFRGPIESITVPGTSGSFQVLNNHAPIVSTLEAGTVSISGNLTIDEDVAHKFQKGEGDVTLFEISSGTLEMRDNNVILLAD